MTAHMNAKPGDVAKIVLMPGDPLRAKFIAETYLTDAKLYNEVRGMLGYTGLYHGVPVSVQGSGMGGPSMAIYSHELFHEYGAETIIRIGTCGAFCPDLKLGDLVFAQGASSPSNFSKNFNVDGAIAAIANYDVLETAVNTAREAKVPFMVGNMLSGDAFYTENTGGGWMNMGMLGCEMEAHALYLNAMRAGKRALAICTVSDELYSDKHATPDERLYSFRRMMEVALETAVKLSGK